MNEIKDSDIEEVERLIKDKVDQKTSTFVVDEHPEILKPITVLLNNKPSLRKVIPGFLVICEQTINTFEHGNRLFVGGNGGSMADAQHIVGELNKSFNRDRSLSSKERDKFTDLPDSQTLCEELEWGLPAITLGANSSVLSAISNDNGYNLSLAQELYALGNKGDLFLGISTSGNSENVVLATEVALAKDLGTAGLTGQTGGRLAQLSEFTVQVPAESTDSVQELHQPLYHGLCGVVEEYFYSKKG